MKLGKFLVLVIVLALSCLTFADRQLERAEILQILEELTSQPKESWLPTGVIEASHQKYRAPKESDSNVINQRILQKISEYQNDQDRPEIGSEMTRLAIEAIPFNVRYELANEYTMTSTEIAKYDGERFYWEINLDSRTDSIKCGKSLVGNYMTDEFNTVWNARRIFVWDGENYTNYIEAMKNAIIEPEKSHGCEINGPLTAGLTRWGYDYYSYENLAVMDSFAEEKYIDGDVLIELILDDISGCQRVYLIDPDKDYAVLSCTITGYGSYLISKQYSDYQLAGGNWVPKNIVLKKKTTL